MPLRIPARGGLIREPEASHTSPHAQGLHLQRRPSQHMLGKDRRAENATGGAGGSLDPVC